MVKLVDAADSKSASERSVGSSPTRGTKHRQFEVCELFKAPKQKNCVDGLNLI